MDLIFFKSVIFEDFSKYLHFETVKKDFVKEFTIAKQIPTSMYVGN